MKFILILLGIYLLFRYLFPIILRIAVGKVLHKAHEQQTRYANANREPKQPDPQNSTANTSTTHKKPLIDDDQGEYVDYVEIK